ncbi:MAG: hypothetical protein Q9216_006277, partial [Gyalolechia sp. 2 TL-2023]
RPHAKSLNNTQSVSPNIPPPKTDKPRPHVCATCTRSFARLEHLKRHERSHTKEKPFECPECSRCFARRDLLLRHQQKLHMTTMPASRQKARRESASSTAASGSVRVRKSSTSNPTGTASMRPRANTISHVDNTTLGMLAAVNSSTAQHAGMDLNLGNSHHPVLGSLPGVSGYHFRGMSTAAGHHGLPHVLPKLDTNHFNADVGASMRTAPPYAGFAGDMDMENIWYGQGNTINPAQLHFSNSPQSLSYDPTSSPYNHNFPGMSQSHAGIDDDSTLGWMSGFENQMSFNDANEHAIDGSSPSAMSTGSHDGLNELMLDGANNPVQTTSMWHTPMMAQAPLGPGYPMDYNDSPMTEFYPPDQLSPKSMRPQYGSNGQYLSSPPPLSSQTPMPLLQGMESQFVPPFTVQAETPSNSAASVSSSNRQSSVTSVSTDSITDATRQALLASLSQPSVFGFPSLKTSQPSVSSPLSPAFARPQSSGTLPLPSTHDLQRYIAAYVKYFHPHLPFLHIPSLSFDSPDFTETIQPAGGHFGYGQSGIAGGAGSLVLAMAAIGAFYEYDTVASKNLFDMAKKMIQLYLEERRKADMSATASGPPARSESSAQNTPLWLVQAMLLNVIYGHNCGDKTAAGIATTHCAALISLARAAELAGPFSESPPQNETNSQGGLAGRNNVQMSGENLDSEHYDQQRLYTSPEIYSQWQGWRVAEERKRTLYAIFILSSLLVTSYNHAPALMNSEIRLDLPCDEELWAAETAEAWAAVKSSGAADQIPTSFASALSSLLTASHRYPCRQSYQFKQPFGSSMKPEDLPESDLRPSTFGCLVLINALHNYIWETRQRHMGRPWTAQETEAMYAHIEPALRAWQAAWASNPQHSLERPNPFGVGSLSADCMPLLDLAYVRLFVNLGRSKEAFFQRDWEGMANELARGHEIVQHAESSPELDSARRGSPPDATPSSGNQGAKVKQEPDEPTKNVLQSIAQPPTQPSTKRERHLRKAAIFAANSLAMSDKLGVTFADLTSRELPLQSALCAFDCAQVLAEWCAAVQQRVGEHLGVLGKDEIDFTQVEAMMLLNEEDCKLFEKINDIIKSAEIKMADSSSMSATAALQSTHNLSSISDYGCGSKVLLITANMLEKAASFGNGSMSFPLAGSTTEKRSRLSVIYALGSYEGRAGVVLMEKRRAFFNISVAYHALSSTGAPIRVVAPAQMMISQACDWFVLIGRPMKAGFDVNKHSLDRNIDNPH